MKALGIHIYAGGFTIGVSKYFEVVAHLENSKFGYNTVKYNFPGINIINNPEAWDIEQFKDIDFIYGNPPCKFFSCAGNKKGNKLSDKYEEQNPVDHIEFQSVCFNIKPKIFCFESVTGIIKHGYKMLNEFKEKCFERGYAVTYVIINTKNHGLAQNRKRVFIVSHKIDFNPVLIKIPPPNVNEILSKVENREPVFLNELQQRILHKLTPGKKLIDIFVDEYGPLQKGRPGFLRRRLDGNSLSRVIATHSDYFHPTENRLLNPAEAAALCGYPKEYVFIGSQNDRFKQIGAAVLPVAGEFIALQVKNSIEKNINIKQPFLNIIDLS